MISKKSAQKLYADSGVDIKKSDGLITWLNSQQEKDNRNNKVGGFAAEFPLDIQSYKNPLLISSTDGVGTKLLLAIEQGNLEGIGIDLVAMCVNDLYTTGAKPLFFLDYYASSSLDREQFQTILKSISSALEFCQCPLLGGETAEMPGLYKNKHFDLAGFVVGIVEKKDKIGSHLVQKNDILFALPSSGFHSNGFSLIRKFLEKKEELKTEELVSKLLTPTKIYHEIPYLLNRLPEQTIHAMAHITGGGIVSNLNRVIPGELEAKIDFKALRTPAWIENFLLNFTTNFTDFESVFNLGCGAVLVVDHKKKEEFENISEELNLSAYPIGEVY